MLYTCPLHNIRESGRLNSVQEAAETNDAEQSVEAEASRDPKSMNLQASPSLIEEGAYAVQSVLTIHSNISEQHLLGDVSPPP